MASSITVRTNEVQVVGGFKSREQSIYSRVRKEVARQTYALESTVKQKLSGEVLNVKTGRLRRSVFATVNDTGESVTGVVSSAGDVRYGKIHEYGGVIHHPGGTPYWYDNSIGAVHFVSNATAARVSSGEFPRTRPHDIHIPERSFMRSSLRQRAALIEAGLKEAVAGAK